MPNFNSSTAWLLSSLLSIMCLWTVAPSSFLSFYSRCTKMLEDFRTDCLIELLNIWELPVSIPPTIALVFYPYISQIWCPWILAGSQLSDISCWLELIVGALTGLSCILLINTKSWKKHKAFKSDYFITFFYLMYTAYSVHCLQYFAPDIVGK